MTHDPLHGSGRAAPAHPALALGDDAHAAQRVGMTDSRQRQPAVNEAPHAVPEDTAVLAAPRQRVFPEPADPEPKHLQRRLVHRHSVVADVATYHRLQPLTLFGDGFVHAPLKFGFHRVQLRLQPFADRLPQHRKHSVAPLLHADVRKAQEIERLRLPFSTPLPVLDRVRTELHKPRLLGMQFQVELQHSLREFRPKLIGIHLDLKAKHDIVRETHHDDLAMRSLSTPRLYPQVEHVVQVDVSQQRRSTSALGVPSPTRIRFPSSSTPAFSHFWMSRTTRRSAIRCSTNLTSHSWESPSKKPLMSRSSTPFTFLVSSPV